MGEVKGSPSGMFWDYVSFETEAGEFKTHDETGGYEWKISPYIQMGSHTFNSPHAYSSYWNLRLYSELRYGGLSVIHSANADSRYESDPYYPAHRERSIRGRIDQGYVQFDYSRGFFRLGRMNRNWGPFSDKSMILSNHPYSYDALEWQFFTSWMEFRHLFAAFPHMRSHWDSQWESGTGKALNRYFGAHSLNFRLGRWITLGITETIVFSRKNGMPDLQYINPFSFYAALNGNQEGDVNLLTGIQWSLRPLTNKIEWKGQIAVDDFQIDDPEESGNLNDKEPNHWGFATEVVFRNPLSVDLDHVLKADYTYASKYLYTVSDENTRNGERYSYKGKSLGYPEMDGDRFSLSFSCAGNNYWTAGLEGAFQRKGQKDMFSKWGDSERPIDIRYDMIELPLDYKDNRFPSGTVETSYELKIKGSAYLWGKTELKTSITSRWIKNMDNIHTGRYEYHPSIHLELSLFHDNLRISLPKQ